MTDKEKDELEKYFGERTGQAPNLIKLDRLQRDLETPIKTIRNFKSGDYGRIVSFSATGAAASASVITLGLTGVSFSLNVVSVTIRLFYGSLEALEWTGAGKILMHNENAGFLGFCTYVFASAIYPVWLACKLYDTYKVEKTGVEQDRTDLEVDQNGL